MSARTSLVLAAAAAIMLGVALLDLLPEALGFGRAPAPVLPDQRWSVNFVHGQLATAR